MTKVYQEVFKQSYINNKIKTNNVLSVYYSFYA